MEKTNGKRKSLDWLTPDFYLQAYNRFNRLRWGVDPIKSKYYFSNLNPDEFNFSEDEISRIPLSSFMAVHLRLSIHSLVGQINHFNSEIFALKVWQCVLRDYRKIQKIQLQSEFTDPLSCSCLLAPFALRNQIIFTGTKIAILLEKGRLHPKLPDDRSKEYSKHFKQWAGNWNGFTQVERSLQRINNEKFNQRTNEFRHRYTHRIPPRVGYGLSPNFKFERDGLQLRVYFSPEKPLLLHQCINASVIQHRACVMAVKAFWTMIRNRLQA